MHRLHYAARSMSQTNRPKRAAEFFHLAPANWNCAQSIHKALQPLTGFSDQEIEALYRTYGGGRAPGGLCGAIYAVRTLLKSEEQAERATQTFSAEAGGLTCAQLRGRCGRSCQELVSLAEDILLESLAQDESGARSE